MFIAAPHPQTAVLKHCSDVPATAREVHGHERQDTMLDAAVGVTCLPAVASHAAADAPLKDIALLCEHSCRVVTTRSKHHAMRSELSHPRWACAVALVPELSVAAPAPCPNATVLRHRSTVVKATRDLQQPWQSERPTRDGRVREIAVSQLTEAAGAPGPQLAIFGECSTVAVAKCHF